MAVREEFVVDTHGLSRARKVEICRFALGLVAGDATRFETDMPFSRASKWPDAVRTAANRLARHSSGRRGQNEGYRSTGMVSAADSEDWNSLVTFACYAYDASVWGIHGELASLADEGDSLALHLTHEDREAFVRFAPEVALVPAKQWKRTRRARRKERRRG